MSYIYASGLACRQFFDNHRPFKPVGKYFLQCRLDILENGNWIRVGKQETGNVVAIGSKASIFPVFEGEDDFHATNIRVHRLAGHSSEPPLEPGTISARRPHVWLEFAGVMLRWQRLRHQ